MRSLFRNTYFIYIAGLAFFFCAFRYYGYYEDAGRYLLQIVHFVHPDRFVDDVPFMFGNQDEFTLFSPIMTPFFKVFGVNCGGIVSILLMELLWGFAALTIFICWNRHWRSPLWILPMFAVCIVTLTNKLYGSGAYFPIIDHIFSARFCSEIFVLMGLAFFWTKNKYIPLGCFLLATLFHPLMGGWGIPLWILYHFPKVCPLLLIFVLLFPLTGFLHFGRLDFFPQEWLGNTLPYAPNMGDTLFFVCLLLFWFVMWKFSSFQPVSKFSAGIFWIYFTGIYWQYTGVVLRHELLVQAQPYRVLWIGFVPMFPVSFLFLREYLKKKIVITEKLCEKKKILKVLFVICAVAYIVGLMLGNVVQLGLEQNIGNAKIAIDVMGVLDNYNWVLKFLLAFFAVICALEKKNKLVVVFIFSLFNTWGTILPVFGILFYIFPRMNSLLKKFLMALAFSISIAEFLSSLPNSPLVGSVVGSCLFLLIIFFAALLLMWAQNQACKKVMIFLLVVSFYAYAALSWDARDDGRVLDEKQMDCFLSETVFPQVKNRGRTLFVENGETPLQSRFKFLTGTYADETINIGEVFFEGQFHEARRRKNLLLNGDTVLRNMDDYGRRIQVLYRDKEALANRVEYLCQLNEITHLVADYSKMPFVKLDSAYLDVKKKYVYLYGCLKGE